MEFSEAKIGGTPIPVLDGLGPGRPAWPRPGLVGDPAKVYATSSELRSRAFLLVSGVLLTAALVVVVVDLAVTRGFGWSRWPLAALAAVWALTASALNWHRSPRAWGTAWFVVVNLWTSGAVGLGWSLVTDLVLLPFSALFYFLHFTLPRTPDLRRIFHF